MPKHLLVTNDYPPKIGGIQVYLYELWRRLDPTRGVVLTATSHDETADFDARATHVIERVPNRTLILPTPRVVRQIEAAIARHDPDLVILDPAWPLGILGPFLSKPYGVILHGAEVAIPARIPVLASSLRRVLRRASVLVASGSYPQSVARKLVGRSDLAVTSVPPGVDTERFVPRTPQERSDARRRYNVGDDDFLVVSYSRLVPRKGMDTLIRAAATLRTTTPTLRVLIGGSGRDRARLERLARRLDAPVVFVGRVEDEDLPAFVGAADVMVMACRNRWFGLEQEGFGIVFVEAGACGVATIAGRSGGSSDAVRHGETGVVLDHPRRADELAAALRDLHDNPERRRAYGAAARAYVEARFAWPHLVTTLEACLTEHGG